MPDEKKLIARILDGDHEAFGTLITEHERAVYRLCLRMTGNQQDAEDLSQEAFLKAWRGLRFFSFESTFSTWLHRLATNVCIDHLRKQKRRPAVSLTMQEEEELGFELEVPDPEPLPEEQLLHEERKEQITAAMSMLDEEFRTVLYWRVVEELSYEEVGEITGLKAGTVKSRLARARLKLKTILQETGNNFGDLSSNANERGREP